MSDPTDFLRLAIDPHRLAILGASVVGPVDAEAMAKALDLPVKRVRFQIAKLQAGGYLTQDLRLDEALLQAVRRQIPGHAEAAGEVVEGPWTADEVKVLSAFFRGDRLNQIPSNRAKRLVVLERIVQEFEPGERYDERHVNLKLQMFHPDYAALRRYLVDEALLTRAEGMYWRSGGRYPV
jgi:hypothetical protein